MRTFNIFPSVLFRFSSCLVSVLTILTASSAYAAPSGLGLREVVREALANNPSVMSAAQKINQADSQIPVVRASALPNLSFIAAAQERKDAVNSPMVRFGGEIYNNYQTDLRLTQPLFTYGTFAALDAARKERDLRKLDREIVERDLTNDVILAYFEVVLRMRNVETLRRQEKIEKESLAVAERRGQTGRGQLLDVLQVKTQLALLKSQISDAENQVKIAATRLANLLGNPKTKEVKVKDVLEIPELQVIDTEVKLKEFRLLELEKNRVTISQIENQKAVSLGAHLPTLSLGGDYYYGSTKQADLFADNAASWSLGLTLTIPLFSGFSSHYQQQGLNAQRMQLEHDRTAIENNASSTQVIARKTLETAAQTILQGKEALKIATAASDEARRMFRLSIIDFVQFLDVQNSYVDAEQSLNKSKFTYIAALVAYFLASGQDMSRLVDVLEEGSGK